MANTRSAEKQNRQAQKHRARNVHVMSTLRTSVRKFREAAASGDAQKTKQELAAAVRQIARAASKGVIHKGQAARRISRLTKAASQPATPAR
ncbi:MAG: 30S ribosomal protein S20 [Myxococcales bacterium]